MVLVVLKQVNDDDVENFEDMVLLGIIVKDDVEIVNYEIISIGAI